jgi:hypothetical protein
MFIDKSFDVLNPDYSIEKFSLFEVLISV